MGLDEPHYRGDVIGVEPTLFGKQYLARLSSRMMAELSGTSGQALRAMPLVSSTRADQGTKCFILMTLLLPGYNAIEIEEWQGHILNRSDLFKKD